MYFFREVQGEACTGVCLYLLKEGEWEITSVCDNDMTDGVGFPRFIPVLLRRGFCDSLAATEEMRNCM